MMKKLIALILATLMLLSLASLAACQTQGETNPTAQTPDATSSVPTDPADDGAGDEYAGLPVTAYHGKSVPELLAEGTKPLVAISMPSFADPIIQFIGDGLAANFAGAGFETIQLDCDSDIPTQISQIENCVTMGAVAVILGSMEPNALDTCNNYARENGLLIVVLGDIPTSHEVDGGVASDFTAFGRAEGEMILAYIDQKYPGAEPGSVKVSTGVNSAYTTMIDCTDATREVLESDPRVRIVFTQDLVYTIDTGYTYAEQSLTFDPDIRIFAVSHDAAAIGVNNYIISIPSVDPSDYAVFNIGGAAETSELIEMAQNGESAVQGAIMYGGSDPSLALFESAYKMLIGEEEAPYWVPEPFWSVNSFGWEYSAEGDELLR